MIFITIIFVAVGATRKFLPMKKEYNLLLKSIIRLCFALFSIILVLLISRCSEDNNKADLILTNGKIITIDQHFSIAEAVAIRNDKIIAVGSAPDIEKLADFSTKIIDLKSKTVIPGLIEAHAHPEGASRSELIEEIPDVHEMNELLSWIKDNTQKKKKGEWIIHPKFFPTRLNEMRFPTLKELDASAPDDPVFLNGSYGGMINSAAMKISNINKNTNEKGIYKDANTGKPTGKIAASAFRLLNIKESSQLTYDARVDALEEMTKRYNSVGITSLCSGSGDKKNIQMYQDMKNQNRLTLRIFQNIRLQIATDASAEEIRQKLLDLGDPSGSGDEWVRVGALKISIDGGILTGTAYLREPWGKKAKEVYGITDDTYRGVLKISKEELITIAKVANEIGWKFTAHCTGGGGVDLMLDAFEEVNKIRPIKDRRFSIIHGNFYTPEAIERMNKLGVYADMQPAWFHEDADAMNYVLGERRIKTFHPYKSLFNAGVIVNGGSDHMVKFDSYSSINPYNPFLAMWSVITRETERGSIIVPEEAITREQALKM